MKVVYISITDPNDLYLEQTLISIETLKKHNSEVEVFLITDNESKRNFVGKRSMIYEVSEVIVAEVPDYLKKNEKAKYIKTTITNYIDPPLLYIDSDTVVCDSFDELMLLDENDAIYSVLDKHYHISQHPQKWIFDKRSKRCRCHNGYDDNHYNSGFIYIPSDKGRIMDFFELWGNLYLEYLGYKINADQVSYNEANYRMNGVIRELDGIWNCQLAHETAAAKYIYNAKMLHYFASYNNSSVPFDLANNDVIRSVLDSDRNKLDAIIMNPKLAFSCVKTLGSDYDEAKILNSYSIKLIKSIHNNLRWLYNLNEIVLKIIYKMVLRK